MKLGSPAEIKEKLEGVAELSAKIEQLKIQTEELNEEKNYLLRNNMSLDKKVRAMGQEIRELKASSTPPVTSRRTPERVSSIRGGQQNGANSSSFPHVSEDLNASGIGYQLPEQKRRSSHNRNSHSFIQNDSTRDSTGAPLTQNGENSPTSLGISKGAKGSLGSKKPQNDSISRIGFKENLRGAENKRESLPFEANNEQKPYERVLCEQSFRANSRSRYTFT